MNVSTACTLQRKQKLKCTRPNTITDKLNEARVKIFARKKNLNFYSKEKKKYRHVGCVYHGARKNVFVCFKVACNPVTKCQFDSCEMCQIR